MAFEVGGVGQDLKTPPGPAQGGLMFLDASPI